ncbi:Hypothetical protein POVN_LOCUS299 [uncultured virus]|nr:Hypothetical protein POVN_LOCUS299 [uncultured virus]
MTDAETWTNPYLEAEFREEGEAHWTQLCDDEKLFITHAMYEHIRQALLMRGVPAKYVQQIDFDFKTMSAKLLASDDVKRTRGELELPEDEHKPDEFGHVFINFTPAEAEFWRSMAGIDIDAVTEYAADTLMPRFGLSSNKDDIKQNFEYAKAHELPDVLASVTIPLPLTAFASLADFYAFRFEDKA